LKIYYLKKKLFLTNKFQALFQNRRKDKKGFVLLKLQVYAISALWKKECYLDSFQIKKENPFEISN
jgi:hypothetical protein